MHKLLKQVVAVAGLASTVGFACGGELYDSSDYVQTGLIAHWDAVENAGRGRQDASRATWKDLTGAHDDLVFPNGCVMGTDANGVKFYNLAKDGQGNDHGCWLSSCADVAQALLDKDCTIEIVCDFASLVDGGALVAVLDGDASKDGYASKRILSVWSFGSNPSYNGTIGPAEYLTNGWVPSGVHIDNNGADSFNFVRSYTMLAGDTCSFYRNGLNTGFSISPGSGGSALSGADPQRAALSFGFWRTSSATAAKAEAADMKIYAVRIYGRRLTNEEITANAKIDQARLFEGQFILGHQLVIESEAGEEIGEPSPSYGRHQVAPGEETTCEAPETVERGSSTFTCVGSQLYTNALEDTGVWLPWGESQEGHAVTFTFPAEGNVRVVWRWDAETSLVTAFDKSFGSGKDAVSICYTIEEFDIPEVGVRLLYGTTRESLDRVFDGGVITSGGDHWITVNGLESGRCYWGKVVFTVGGKVVSETEVFTLATTDRIAYWPLNSSNLTTIKNVTCFNDQSGNGYELVIDPEHVAVESNPESPDGECVMMDGKGSYLKTSYDPSTVGADWLLIDPAEGLTFFFRLKGCAGSDPAATWYDIFEVSGDYNHNPGSPYVSAEKKDGKWYLAVAEKNNSSKYAYYRCTEPLDDSFWQNVVVVFAKKNAPDCFAVYVNGVRQTLELVENYNASMKDVPYANQYLYIGGRDGKGTTAGLIDDFGICGYAYDANEVARLTADLSAKSGSLFVEATDAGACSMQPAAGDHSGFAAGQVVPFERKDLDGVARGWSLLEYDETGKQWTEVKRGYGHSGKFTHTGGRMRLCWDVDMTRKDDLKPICRWTFEDQTGRNEGSIGADGDLEFSGKTAANGRYLAIPAEPEAFASTKSTLQLASADGLTLGFCLRNPEKRSDTTLFELSQNFNVNNGSFMVSRDSTDGHWELGLRGNNRYNVVLCNPNEYTDRIADGNWHYCTFVVRKDAWPNLDFYIDGVLMPASQDSSGHKFDASSFTFANDQKLWLCHRNSSNTQKADIDNVTLYPQAFSSAEVYALYSYESRVGASLVVTAKKAVPLDDLPIPGFGTVCSCTVGETLSFDFTRGPYTVAGSQGKYRLTGWTLYRLVDGEWTEHAKGSNPLVEFIHPGGRVKLELNFGVPGLAIVIN